MSGCVRISRDIFDDTAFKDEPFSEREAFMWLIMEASFKDREKRLGSKVVALKRGQLAASSRFMAAAWGWSEARVRRYLDRLKNRRMIDASTDAGLTVVSVCKYDEYQAGNSKNDAPKIASSTRHRRTADANENKGEINGYSVSEDTEGEPSVIDFDPKAILFGKGRAWLQRIAGLSDDGSRKLIGKWMKAAGDEPAKVLEAFRRCREVNPSDPVSWISGAIQPKTKLAPSGYPIDNDPWANVL